jgi:uncharacterized protein (DUF433 family)
MGQFTRINHDIEIMGGKACIKGTRVTVGMLLMRISEGVSVGELLGEYPYLTGDDIAQALKYAAWTVDVKESGIVSALNQNSSELDKGAILSVDTKKARVRLLPL